MNRVLKWLPAVFGGVLFVIGLVMKVAEKPASYDQFISNNSYIFLVLGIEAVILNYAFISILNNNEKK